MDGGVFKYDWLETNGSFNYENKIRELFPTNENAEIEFLEDRIQFFNSEIEGVRLITDEELENYIFNIIQELIEYKKGTVDEKEEIINYHIDIYKDMLKFKINMCENYIFDYKFKLSRLILSRHKESKGNLLEGKKLNLVERHKIANEVFNIDKTIINLNISDTERHILLSYILGCNQQTARELYNGTQLKRTQIREDMINKYLESLHK